jgi:hypothetical protein
LLDGGDTLDLIWVTLVLSLNVGAHILSGLLNITCDIESVTGSLGDGETVVESNATWDGTETAGIC